MPSTMRLNCQPKILLAALLFLSAGCPNPAPSAKNGSTGDGSASPSSVATRVLVLDDPHLADAIEREWRAHSEEELTVKRVTSADALALKRLGTDVIVMPTELLGDFVEADRLAPIPDSTLTSKDVARESLFPRLRGELVSWGKAVYALPLGSPTLQLFYRADVFDKLGLKPPATWEEYGELLPKLADREALGDLAPAEDGAWSPSAEPLAPGWAGKLLLTRAAAYAADPQLNSPFLDLNTLEPRITSPALSKALTELVAAAKDRPTWQQLTPEAARKEIIAGRCAMSLTWPSGVREEKESATPKALPIRIAALPGSAEFYSVAHTKWQPREGEPRAAYLGTAGCVAAVANDCRRPSVALHFLTWLTNSDSSDRISAQAAAGSPTRETQAPRADQWIDTGLPDELNSEYFGLLRDDLSRSSFLPPVRLPAHIKMMKALDEAVAHALADQRTPEEALAEAAAAWKQTLDGLDAERTRASVRRGLNLSQ